MTKLLTKAIEAMQSLPEDKQDQLAQLVLHEIEDDARWEATTDRKSDAASRIVADVMDADRRNSSKRQMSS
jgi:hypothetical protein